MQTEKIKQIYDEMLSRDNAYEARRWHSSSIARAGYEMTAQTLERHCLPLVPSAGRILELGPGPGTWTKFILRQNLDLNFDLLEISEGMLNEAKKNLAEFKNVNFILGDFFEAKLEQKYKMFFSSRALEYLPDKKKGVKKIWNSLEDDGVGFIITKMPRYFAYKILKRKVPEMHRLQISDNMLKKMLADAGFKKVKVYPASMTLPLFKSALLNKLVFSFLGRFQVTFLSRLFCESYSISFRK